MHELKEKRLLAGLTQQELAQRANLSQGYISSYERGKREIPCEKRKKLEMILGMEVGRFVYVDKMCEEMVEEHKEHLEVTDHRLEQPRDGLTIMQLFMCVVATVIWLLFFSFIVGVI
tara:strand:+ start:433 stop:783 length:351 start_codon:yes stop_codon:yes gene_type:complete